jgi:hypothetical protein
MPSSPPHTAPMRALLLALAAAAAAAVAAATPDGDSDPWPPSGHRLVDVALPPYETAADEEYLCTAVALPDGVPLKLTSVAPLASKQTVHHMLLFG